MLRKHAAIALIQAMEWGSITVSKSSDESGTLSAIQESQNEMRERGEKEKESESIFLYECV